MFKLGMYSRLLLAIIILLAVNIVLTAAKSSPSSPLVKSAQSSQPVYGDPNDYVTREENMTDEEWENYQVRLHNPEMRDYQIDARMDKIIIYDGTRYVATLHYTSSLGKIILKDNQ